MKSAEAEAEPTPFGVERARAIWAQRGPMWDIDKAITPGERAYVIKVWDRLPGSSCFMDAFLEILNGRHEPIMAGPKQREPGDAPGPWDDTP